MDGYKVKIYPAARRDLKDLISYLNTLSTDATLRYYDLIIEKIGSLSQMLERCPYVHNNPASLTAGRTFLPCSLNPLAGTRENFYNELKRYMK